MSQLAKQLIAVAKYHKLKYLDLGNCGLNGELPEELFDQYFVENLQWLSLGNRFVRGIEVVIIKPDTDLGAQIVSTSNKGEPNDFSGTESCFERLEHLKNLKILSIGYLDRSGKLFDASFLQYCPKVEHLGLWGNQFTNFNTFPKLPKLKYLSLAYNKIKSVKDFPCFPQLTILDMGQNEISTLEKTENWQQLIQLDIKDNLIVKIENLNNLPKLEKLDLSNNEIAKIENLDNLSNLQVLYLENNQINNIENLENLPNLLGLNLSVNQISKIENLNKVNGLIGIDLSHNRISKIENLNLLPKLTDLVLSYNKIFILENLNELPSLIWLSLSKNSIVNIENSIDLPCLEDLYLKDNQIAKLKNLDKLPKLIRLDLENNKLAKIENLDNLVNLQVLNLKFNQLTKIENLEKLPNLKKLDLSINKITSHISLSFLNLFPELDSLNISGNSIVNIPISIIDGNNCLQYLLDYLYDLEEGSGPNNEVKLLLIGNGNVGKTQIAKRLAFTTNFVFDEQHHSTHAISLLQRNLPCPQLLQQGLQLNIWDFGGQDIYHATHRLFMRTRALFVLVWDKESETTPHHTWRSREYKNEQLLYWLSYTRYFGEGSPVLVVQNKLDAGAQMPDQYPIPVQDELKMQFPAIADFIAVSAKTGTSFILLEEVIGLLFTQNEALHNELIKQLPRSWLKVRNRIRQEQGKTDGLKVTDFANFQNWCKEAGIEKSAQTLVDFFHNTGVFFCRSKYFSGRIILDQAWAIEAVYKILDRQGKYIELLEYYQGKIKYNTICKIWADNTDDERKLFLDFMISSELCFETTPNKQWNTPLKERTFIVPQLLPEKEPEFIGTEQDYFQANVSLPLSYDFLPSVFIQRFIIKAHLFSLHQYMWQHGIGIKHENNAFAVVRASYTPTYSITIHYNEAAVKGGLLKSIQEELEKLENEDKNIPQPLKEKSGLEALSRYRTHNKDTNMANEQIQTLISQGKIKEALSRILQTDSEITQLQSRLSTLEQQERMGTISTAEANLERNRIRHALLGWLDLNNTENNFIEPIKKVVVNSATQKTVLFICSSPSDVTVLNFGDEFKKIEDALNTSRNRDKYKIEIKTAVQFDQLSRLLLHFKPNVLHLSMHSSLEQGGLLFQDQDGKKHSLSPESFCKMLNNGFKNNPLDLLVLSACNSQIHAKLIDKAAKQVIGMNDFISDEAAAYYASQFYEIYFDHADVDSAHETAITNLEANYRLENHLHYSQVPYIQNN